MSDSQFHDEFVALLIERWKQQESTDEIDRDLRFMVFASGKLCMTGRGNPPPRPLHEILDGIRATGRGGPSPRPLQPTQSRSTCGRAGGTGRL